MGKSTLKLQSDERLLRLFRRGINAAFDELVNRYRPALVAYAGSIAGPDRAEDVVQDSLVKAHRSLQDDRPIDPRPWLYSLVRNTALNDIRDNRKHRHVELGETSGPVAAPDDAFEQRERFAAVLAAVANLPPAQRRALVDHELSGLSHEEIAAELELTTGATKQLIYRARISLRNAFGAMIPLPLVARLSETPGLFATGAAGTGATATGLVSTMGGAGAAKLAVVAVVAGSTLAGGIAVEHNQSVGMPGGSNLARAANPPTNSGESVENTSAETTSIPTDRNDSGGGDQVDPDSAAKLLHEESPRAAKRESEHRKRRDSGEILVRENQADGESGEMGLPGHVSETGSSGGFQENRPDGRPPAEGIVHPVSESGRTDGGHPRGPVQTEKSGNAGDLRTANGVNPSAAGQQEPFSASGPENSSPRGNSSRPVPVTNESDA